jgi:hypothetical protein
MIKYILNKFFGGKTSTVCDSLDIVGHPLIEEPQKVGEVIVEEIPFMTIQRVSRPGKPLKLTIYKIVERFCVYSEEYGIDCNSYDIQVLQSEVKSALRDHWIEYLKLKYKNGLVNDYTKLVHANILEAFPKQQYKLKHF